MGGVYSFSNFYSVCEVYVSRCKVGKALVSFDTLLVNCM